MTIAATLLTSGSDSTDASSYTTASISPAADSLLVCFALSAGATTAPDNVFSGLALTFIERATVTVSTGARKLTLVTAQCGASPGSGTLLVTATSSIVEAWAVIQVTGHDAVTPVVQAVTNSNASGTTGTVTLAGDSGAGNRPFAAFAHRAQTSSTPKTNWSELSDDLASTPATGLMTEWRSDAFESAASATWTTASAWVGIAVEIAAATVQVTGTADGTFPALTATALGVPAAVEVTGTVDGTFPAYTATALGEVQVTGTADGTFPALTATALGAPAAVQVTGTADGTLPALTATALGAPAVEVVGTADGTFPALAGTALGAPAAVQVTGTADGTLPALTATALGAPAVVQVTGAAGAAFPALTGTAWGGKPWSPAELTALSSWYDPSNATARTITTSAFAGLANRQGVVGRNLGQGTATLRPALSVAAINGLDAMSFDGVDNWLNHGAPVLSAAGGHTVAAIFKAAAQTDKHIIGEANFGSSVIYTILRSQNPNVNGGPDSYYQTAPGTVSFPAYGNATAPFLDGTTHLEIAVDTGGTVSHVVDGFNVYSHSYTRATLVTNTFNVGCLRFNGGTFTFFAGLIGEIVCCTGALSTGDRQKLEGYLAHKWGSAALLDAGHPYKAASPGPTGPSIITGSAVANFGGSAYAGITGPLRWASFDGMQWAVGGPQLWVEGVPVTLATSSFGGLIAVAVGSAATFSTGTATALFGGLTVQASLSGPVTWQSNDVVYWNGTAGAGSWSAITHNFPGTTVDTSVWTGSYGTAPTVASNKMSFATSNGVYSGRLTTGYNLIGSEIAVQIPDLPSGGFTGITLKGDSSHTSIADVALYPTGSPTKIQGRYFGGAWAGSDVTVGITTAPQAGMWLRFKVAAGVLTTEYSMDGTAWVVLSSSVPSGTAMTALTDCKLELGCGPFPNAMTAGGSFAKLNLTPAGVPGGVTDPVEWTVGSLPTSAIAAASFGGLTADASGVRIWSGTAGATFGDLTTVATGLPTVVATAAFTGGLTADASGVRDTTGTAAADLGGLVAGAVAANLGNAIAVFGGLDATATSQKDVSGVADGAFGGLTATSTGVDTRSGTADATFSGLTSSVTGERTVLGAVAVDLGFTATSTGGTTVLGVATGDLGFTATSTGETTVFGAATGDLGSFESAASGGQFAVVPGSATVGFGGLTATFIGVVTRVGTVQADFGGLTSSVTGERTTPGVAQADFGGLTSSVTGERTTPGVAQADFGELTVQVTAGLTVGVGTAAAPLTFEAYAYGRREVLATAQAAFGGLMSERPLVPITGSYHLTFIETSTTATYQEGAAI